MGFLPIRIKKKVVSEEELRAKKEQDIERRKELEKQADFYTQQSAGGVPMPTVPMVSQPVQNLQQVQYTSPIQQQPQQPIYPQQQQQQVKLAPAQQEQVITIDEIARNVINLINSSSTNADERNAFLDMFMIEFLKASELKPIEKIRLLEGLKFL